MSLIGIGVAIGLFISCNLTERNLGTAPVGPVEGLNAGGLDSIAGGWIRDSVSSNMSIFASPHSVKAGNKGRSTVTVQVFDATHNPLAGKRVRFAASLGTITASDTTDAAGLATATYVPIAKNGQARILAAAEIGDSVAIVGTYVQLEGLTIGISPLSKDTLLDQSVPVTVTVTDGDSEPVAAATVKLTGAKDDSGVTNGTGQFMTSVKGSQEGTVKVTASALGATNNVSVGFWKNPPVSNSRTLLLFADPSRLPAALGETSKIRAVLYDESHNPVIGKAISFTTNHGLITQSDTTGQDGAAEAVFQGLAENVDANVTASYQQGDSLRSASTTVTLIGLQMEVKPSTEEAVTGDTIPVSIRLRDASGNPMPGVTLTLRGTRETSLRTNPSGVVNATAVSATEQALVVAASALGASDSAKIVFLKTLPNSSSSSKPAVGNLRIFLDRSTLKASNTDETQVRVVAFDKFNNPLAGRPVRFTATHGIITSSDTTDDKGEASATYRSVPINVDARITASMTVDDSALAVATTVTLSGLEISVQPSLTDALLNRQVPVAIRILDGAGSPVTDATVLFNGNPGVGTTDGDGVFRTSVTSGSQKRVIIAASALGAQDTGYVDFWSVLPDKSGTDVNTIRKMRIFSSRSQLRADNSDFAVISVILTNENNNPAVGESVHFTSDLGIIGQSAVVDSSGRASVILHSAPVNGSCHVVATAVGRNLSATTDILFNGVTLQLVPARTDLKVGEAASIEAFLKDASGNPIGGDQIAFSLTGPGAFDNGNPQYATVLNPNGRALVRVTSSAAGKISVQAAALNTADSTALNFSNNSLTLASSKSVLGVGGKDTTLITATYVDGAGKPVKDSTITFAANAGTIVEASAVTDSTGKAKTHLVSATFAGTATVQANASGGVAQINVDFSSSIPKAIKLSITADNISVNGGVATLRAEVSDAGGNMVSGQDVNFRILQGPGGGESITKPVVRTQAGVALSQLQSGTLPSGYRGTIVVASVGNLADTSKLTLSGAAHIITVARPEDDSVPVGAGGIRDESTFEYYIGAVVQDINGNAVADGTEVHFSAVVTGMAVGRRVLDKWAGLGGAANAGEVKPVYKIVYRDIPFEDINNNMKMDPGIDLTLDGNNAVARRGEDVNGDGKFDWDASKDETWFDFDGDGKCDSTVGENDTVVVNGKTLFADLNGNGIRDKSETLDKNGHAKACDLPPSGDYPFATWEVRDFLPTMTFRDNEFAVAIDVSAVTKDGVAQTRLRYPRQFARRLFVNVNAESNGIRDKDGERFILPQIGN